MPRLLNDKSILNVLPYLVRFSGRRFTWEQSGAAKHEHYMGRIDSYENEFNRHHWSYRSRSYSSASAMSGIVFQVI